MISTPHTTGNKETRHLTISTHQVLPTPHQRLQVISHQTNSQPLRSRALCRARVDPAARIQHSFLVGGCAGQGVAHPCLEEYAVGAVPASFTCVVVRRAQTCQSHVHACACCIYGPCVRVLWVTVPACGRASVIGTVGVSSFQCLLLDYPSAFLHRVDSAGLACVVV